MTYPSAYLQKNNRRIEDYNQIKKEVKNLIENHSKYKLKNITHDGLCETLESEAEYTAWFVELMDYSVSIEIVQSLHNYFGGECIIKTDNTVTHGGITIVFSYKDIKFIKQNWEDEVI